MNRSFLTGALLASAILAAPAGAAEKVIHFGVNDHLQTPYVQAVSVFKDKVEQGAPGRLRVEIYPSAQLGTIPEMFENVQAGAQEMSVMAPAYASQFYQPFDVLELPYLIDSAEQGRTLLESQPLKDLTDEAEGTLGVKIMGVMPIGFRHAAISTHPIRGLEDLKGVKLRIQNSPVHLEAFRALGVAPVAIDWGETYQAVQTGVVDGLENAMNILLAGGFPKVAPHIGTTSHVYGTMIFFMNQDFFDGLDAEDQALIESAWQAAMDANHDFLARSDADVESALQEAGAEIVHLTPEQLASFKQATQSVRDGYGKRFEPHYSALQAVLEAQ